MIDLPGNPVYAALQEQLVDEETPVNLVPLWIASGRRPNFSPRRLAKRGAFKVLRTEGYHPDDPIYVGQGDALRYACRLDDEVMDAVVDAKVQARRADPVGSLLAAPNTIAASLALTGIMAEEELDREQATSRIMAEVIERTEELDEMERETLVAQIQRGLAAVRSDEGV